MMRHSASGYYNDTFMHWWCFVAAWIIDYLFLVGRATDVTFPGCTGAQLHDCSDDNNDNNYYNNTVNSCTVA